MPRYAWTLFTLFVAALPAVRAAAADAPDAADNECVVPADAVVRKDLAYVTRPTGPVTLDLYTPPGDGPFPLVVWVHGGAWKMGDKAQWPHANFLLRRGYAVANVAYRFSQVAPFPAQEDDCLAALDFLAAHAGEYRIDPTRLAVAGESAGGHLAALAGMARPANAPATRPAAARVRAVVDLFGPTDLAALAEGSGPHDSLDALLGGPVRDKRELAARASPITHVAADDPPFLVLHGTADPLVPIAQSETFVAALQKAGVPVEYVPVEGAGHAGPAFWTPALRDKMVAFLTKHLAKAP